MKNYKQVTVLELDSIKCDVCKCTYHGTAELQEFICVEHSCGYGSIFGDGTTINLDICQSCFKNKFWNDINIEEPE